MATKNKKIKNGIKISNTVNDAKAIAKAMRTGLNISGGFYKSKNDYSRKTKHKGRDHAFGNDSGLFLCLIFYFLPSRKLKTFSLVRIDSTYIVV